MALLPPMLIPNIEPTPLPSTDVWNQPDGLRPHYSDQTNAFIDNAPIPSPDLVEEKALMDELSHTTMLPLRHLMSYLHPRSCLREYHHHRIGNRKPNPPQRRLPSAVADVTNPAPRAHCHSGRSKTSRNYAH